MQALRVSNGVAGCIHRVSQSTLYCIFSAVLSEAIALLRISTDSNSPFASGLLARAARAALLILVFSSSPATCTQLAPKVIQEALIWTGFYEGPLDGELGAGSLAAIRRFQTVVGDPPTGALKDTEVTALLQQAQEQKARVGFTLLVDEGTGASMGFPTALVSNRQFVTNGTDFSAKDNGLIIGIRHYNCGSDIASVFNNLKAALNVTAVGYAVQRANWFVISGTAEGRKYYLRFFSVPTGYDGIFVSYQTSSDDRDGPALIMLSLTFTPLTAAVSQRLQASNPVRFIPVAREIIHLPIGPTPERQQEAGSPPAPPLVLPQQAAQKPIYLDSNNDADASKLLLDSVQTFVSQSSGNNVRFFRYVVDKTHLSGFTSDMPILRIVFPERVFFDTDKWNLRPEAAPILESIALSLRKQVRKVALFVAGHTDSRGSEKYNLDLSIRRADFSCSRARC